MREAWANDKELIYARGEHKVSLYEPSKAEDRVRREPARDYKKAIEVLGFAEYESIRTKWAGSGVHRKQLLDGYDKETLIRIINNAIDGTRVEELGRQSQLTREASRGNYAYAATLERERSALHQVGDMLETLVATAGEFSR